MIDGHMINLITVIQSSTSAAVGFMVSAAGFGSALGWALIGSKYMESIARQPELTSNLRVQMFITGGLMESFPFIALAIAMWFVFANPFMASAEQSILKLS
ncbi:ATP synthase subunit c [Gammaproteobacteria bacterium]